jgi:hypothetical protein
LQRNKEGEGIAVVAFFFCFFCYAATHCGATVQRTAALQGRAAQRCAAALQGSAMLRCSAAEHSVAGERKATKSFFCLLWSYTAAVPLHRPAEKLHCKESWNFVLKKKTTAAATFFALLQGNGKFAFLLWFCCEEGDGSNVVTFLYGGGYYFFFEHAYDVVP